MAEKYNDAIKTLNTLIEKKPTYAKAFFQRARSYQGLQDFLKAEEDYRKAGIPGNDRERLWPWSLRRRAGHALIDIHLLCSRNRNCLSGSPREPQIPGA
jgi:tetratricopeptide (TPR) repeat protein